MSIFLTIAVLGIATGLYLLILRRISPEKHLLLMTFRISILAVLLWLCINPTITTKRTRKVAQIFYFLVDTSKSMSITDELSPPVSRIEAINSLFTGKDGLTDYFQDKKIDWEIVSFGDTLTKNQAMPLQAAAQKSNHLKNLEEFFEGLDRDTPVQIFMLSDGRSTEHADPQSIEYPYPVSTVGLGTPHEQTDLWIQSVDAPAVAEIEQKVELKVHIGEQKIPAGTRISLKMEDESGAVVEEKKLVSPVEQVQKFSFVPDKAGVEIFTFVIESKDINELYLTNNEESTGLLVRKNFIKVMVIGSPSWDMEFLLRSLRGIKNIKTVVYNLVGSEKKDFFSISKRTTVKPEEVFTELWQQDACILFDVPASLFTGEQAKTITRFVSDKDGGMLIIGGTHSLGSGGYIQSPIAPLVPFIMNSTDFVNLETKITVPSAKKANPLISNFLQNNDLENLPPLEGFNLSYKPKPSAEVFLELRLNTGTTVPLLAVMKYGAGKSAVFSGRGFYRWDMHAGSASSGPNVLDRLIPNLIGCISSAGEDAFLHVTIPGVYFPLGEKVPVEVVVLDRTYAPAQNSRVSATVTSASGMKSTLEFLPVQSEPSTWKTAFLPPGSGKYHIEITGFRSANDASTIKTNIIVHSVSEEFKFLAADWTFLKQIAHLSGGNFYDLKQFENYTKSLKPQYITQTKKTTHLVIDYPYILILIVTLATLEWFIRIREGLN